MDTGRRVGAGSPAKGPGLLANFHPPFTVAAATVFAGKPAPTPDRGWTHIGDWTQPVVGAGSPANTGRAGAIHRVGFFADMPAQSPRSVSLAPPASRARR
ncbi:hypothetical protein PRJ_3044 [Pseudomonas sp. XWY-1]|nr:hypothetical protein PRJ_3044 [Pseudomonas sp. XWY-1]QNV67844.1 hypothetical protein F7661_19740 [Pseudomonas sp. CFA]